MQLSRRRRFAGVVRAAREYSGFRALQNLCKVKAHVEVDACKNEFEEYCARGNDAADALAKAALRRHPGQSEYDLKTWTREWTDAVATARLIAEVGPTWPAARPREGRHLVASARRTAQHERQAAAAAQRSRRQEALATHQWRRARGLLRCAACMVPRSRTGAAAAPCPGKAAWLTELVAQPQGHRLYAADVVRPGETPGPLVICMKCGSWTESGCSAALRDECNDKPSSKHAASAIDRARRGLFPKPGKAAKEGMVQSHVSG